MTIDMTASERRFSKQRFIMFCGGGGGGGVSERRNREKAGAHLDK
jgi:hypothetical protein